MKTLLLTALFVSSSAFAMELKCEAKHNAETVLSNSICLKDKAVIGEVEGFRFMANAKSQNIVELEAYNSYEPSRTYATGSLDKAGAFVDLAIWKREFLMEVRCTRL
ncbi:hypothetical protein [Peredibacter starrii]|uniref:Uncharacterized protein n=1 Tax=Peredibacter starrii TaxID=28202 RepID=A0AAX4HTX5_9BACT|nr:hypothetical protein [Peredibacter starrii]WPU66850.1 hypothetical protein SOO65_08820 [Peredibacter starrii]